MTLSKKALQLKREKKKKKRPLKITHSSPSILTYSHWSIHECWVPTGLWKAGIGQIIVSRKNNENEIAAGLYLIDTFCLGVKNCFVRLLNPLDYEDIKNRTEEVCGELEYVDPVYAHTLVNKAIQYAERFGFQPHAEFSKARHLLNNIPLDEALQFTFGTENKPCYVQGPSESPRDVKRILNTLELNAGRDNYHFIVEVPNENSIDLLGED